MLAVGVGAGIAVGSGATEERSSLVDVPEVGLQVPVRTTEVLAVAQAVAVAPLEGEDWIFRAPGDGEYAGMVCIFVANRSAGTSVVPMACDTPQNARTKGIDLGRSTADGGISGVVVREVAGVSAAEAYRVGPRGGSVVVNPGGGDPITLRFPDLTLLDERANSDAVRGAGSAE
jgi:hypothetical protein